MVKGVMNGAMVAIMKVSLRKGRDKVKVIWQIKMEPSMKVNIFLI